MTQLSKKEKKILKFSVFLLMTMILFVSVSSEAKITSQNSLSHLNQTIDLENAIFNSNIVVYYTSNSSSHNIDGSITESEYLVNYNDSRSGMSLYIDRNQSDMFIGLVSPSDGWLAIGFNQLNQGMDDANFFMCSVVNGVTTVRDATTTDHHAPTLDNQSEVTDDVLAAAGSSSNGKTTVEFITPLLTTDPADFNFAVNQSNAIFLAYSTSTDFTKQHHAHSNILSMFIAPDYVHVPYKTILTTSIIPSDSQMEITEYENFTFTATLMNATNNVPINNESVYFYLKTSVGMLLLGSNTTDANGFAKINTMIDGYQVPGNITLIASTKHSLKYFDASSTISLPFIVVDAPVSSDPTDFIAPGITIIAVIGSLSAIWIIYGFIYFSIFRISREPLNKKKTVKGDN
ncbi:MAG: DOMON domain-containing protein [Candidatus Thorarchaeota archaeon]